MFDSGKLPQTLLKVLACIVPLAFCVFTDDTYDLPKMTLAYLGALALLGIRFAHFSNFKFFRRVLSGDCPLAPEPQGTSPVGSPPLLGSLPSATGAFGQFPVHPPAKFKFICTPLDIPLTALVLWMGVCAYFSWDPAVSLLGQYGHYTFGLLPILSFILIYRFSAGVFQGGSAKKSLIRIILITQALAAFYALLQFCDLEPFSRIPRVPWGRVFSTMGNPLYMGAYLMMGTLLAAGWTLKASLREKALPAALTIFLLLAMSLSQSRSAWMGLAGGWALLAVLYFKLRQNRKNLALSLGFPLLAALALAFFSPSIRNRLASIPQENLRSARVTGWAGGIRIALNHPLFGTGPDTFVQSFRKYKDLAYYKAAGGAVTHAHAHNDLIQWAATTGLPGLGLYLWIVLAFARLGFSVVKRSSEPILDAAILSSLLGLWIQNLFNFTTVSTAVTAAILLGALLSGQGGTYEIGFPPSAWLRKGLFCALIAALLFGACWAVRPFRADLAYKSGLSAGGDRLRAAFYFEKAVRLNPWVSDYRRTLSNLYRDMAKSTGTGEEKRMLLNRAVYHLSQDAGRHPMSADSLNNLGVGLMAKGQMLGEDLRLPAFEAFKKSVEIDPLSAEAWANHARMAHFFGEKDMEIKIWKYVLFLSPEHAVAKKALEKLTTTAAKAAKATKAKTARETGKTGKGE